MFCYFAENKQLSVVLRDVIIPPYSDPKTREGDARWKGYLIGKRACELDAEEVRLQDGGCEALPGGAQISRVRSGHRQNLTCVDSGHVEPWLAGKQPRSLKSVEFSKMRNLSSHADPKDLPGSWHRI